MIHVGISDFKISQEKELLKTTLGSCVSIVLYSSLNEIATMSHYLLPKPFNFNIENIPSPIMSAKIEGNPWRFGSILLLHQLNSMLKLGCTKTELRAKISGGATMFPTKTLSTITDVGNANTLVAQEFLKKEGIPITGNSCGGNYGRSIIFNPETKQLQVHILGHETYLI